MTTKTLLAYHGKSAIKRKYLARVAAHRAADVLTQGVGWEKNGTTKGCAVGCTLEAYDHARYPKELGIPEALAYLEDAIFEGLSRAEAVGTAKTSWPYRFLKAIPEGADLSLVWHRFAHWLLVDEKDGVIRFAGTDERTAKAIREVAALHGAAMRGESVSLDRWHDAARAARAAAGAARAAAGAAWDAAGAAWDAAGAAWDAAGYAAGAAAGAAWDAAGAAAGAAARAARAAGAAHWRRMAEKLLELLREAPVARKRKVAK